MFLNKTSFRLHSENTSIGLSLCCCLCLFVQEVDEMLKAASRARPGNDLFRTLGDRGEVLICDQEVHYLDPAVSDLGSVDGRIGVDILSRVCSTSV